MEWIKKNKGFLLLLIGIVGLIAMNMEWPTESEQVALEYAQDLVETIEQTESSSDVVVEIKGEVMYPGIFEVEDGLRVGDIIALAGGLTSDADTSGINQAAKITDEMIIYIPKITTTQTVDASIVRIVVEIKGEVKYPGVYSLYSTSRVMDLIEEAGGVKDTADLTNVDLAARLVDGSSIVIPKIEATQEETEETTNIQIRYIYVEILGEVIRPGTYYIPEDYNLKDLIYDAGGVTTECDLSKVDWDVVLVLGATIYIPSYDDEITQVDESGFININTASVETLITLPGIGNILAQRIIDYRAENGNFQSIEEIMNVSGIKTSVYEQIKELITV